MKQIYIVFFVVIVFFVACGNTNDGNLKDNERGDGIGGDTDPDNQSHEIDIEKELMIIDLSVVNDTRATGEGSWSFWGLMKNISGEQDPSDFILKWLKTWTTISTIEGTNEELPARNAFTTFIDRWKGANGKLTPEKTPFRLLAIVNRLDLEESEGRFVYGAINTDVITNDTLKFTVIFEFKLLGDRNDWAKKWHGLGSFSTFSDDYKKELEVVTNEFTTKEAMIAGQLRTNEFLNTPWELREFKLNQSNNLVNVTVKQTPRINLQKNPVLTTFIKNNADAINDGLHVVPENLLGGRSVVPNNIIESAWDVDNRTGILPKTRRQFSLMTCNGCHGAETNTLFLHISPRNQNVPAQLSEFLTGTNTPVPDPLGLGVPLPFNDLQRRLITIKQILKPVTAAATSVGISSKSRVH